MNIVFIGLNIALVLMTCYLFYGFRCRRMVISFAVVVSGYLLTIPMMMSASYSGLFSYGFITLGIAGIFLIAFLISIFRKEISAMERFQYGYLAVGFATLGLTSILMGGLVGMSIT